MAMNPSMDDTRHGFHNEILQGLDLAQEQLSQKEAPRVTAASKIMRPTRHREGTDGNPEAIPDSPPRRTRYESSSYKEMDRAPERRAQRSGYEDDPNDMRNRIARRELEKEHEEREAERRDPEEPEEEEELGSPFFSSRIRRAKKPKRFMFAMETPKYDGTQEPEAWLDDYLMAVKF